MDTAVQNDQQSEANRPNENDKMPESDKGNNDKGRENDKNDPERRARSKRLRLILFAVLILALIAAIPIYGYFSSRESTDDAQIDGHVVPISSRINGTVLSVLVDDNQVVIAGQELTRLDPTDYKVQFDQSQADVSASMAQVDAAKVSVPLTQINTASQIRTTDAQVVEARAGVTSAQRQVDVATARLASARAQLSQAEANNNKAQKDLVRYKELVQKDEISQSQYDSYVAAAQTYSAQVETAQAGIIEAQHNIDVAQAQLGQARARLNSANVSFHLSQSVRPRQEATTKAQYQSAEAQLKQKQAALEHARLQLDYTLLRAPVSGLVSKKNAEPGMRVSPGQQIMALIPLDDIWVTANFKETQLDRMRVGQEVQVKVDAYNGRKYRAHIDSIAAASGAKFSLLPPENATGNFVKVVQRVPVKIVFEPGQNQDHLLRPGMSVEPTVLLNSK
jgi:membrane fusion protein (multidrug efflux system)